MNTTFVAIEGLENAPLADGGAVLYSAKSGKFIRLNRTADRLWSDLSAPRTEEDLVRGLCEAYPGIEGTKARTDVTQALESLRQLELVQPAQPGVTRTVPPSPGSRTGWANTEYAPPSVEVLGEEDLLKAFQMTAAEISVALCWWGACTAGCP